MHKLKKIIFTIAIFIIGILASTMVNANGFTVCDGEEGVINGRFFPHQINGEWVFCGQHGGAYNATLSRALFNAYPVGSTTAYGCVQCGPHIQPPWTGSLKYLRYERGKQFVYWEHQDEAYILADAIERGDLASWDTAYATWASSVSNPRQSYAQAAEGIAYKTFYDKTHDNATDKFNTMVKDQTNVSGVKVGVNQENGTYTVGPFRVDYPDGQYGGINKFSWINSIKAVTNAGTYDVEVLTLRGTVLSGLGKDQSNTLNGKDFYIRFSSREATSVSVKIDFGYLESCYAEMWEYNGIAIERYWEQDTKHDYCNNHWMNIPGSCPGAPHCTKEESHKHQGTSVRYTKDGKGYILREREAGATQNLVALVGTATKNYKETSVTLVPGGIDLTMKIAGNVFLDKETGKVNTGNDRFDGNLGEALPGVEVTLYDENGNKVTIPYNVKHVHTGSSSQGTGCYTVPVYHTHDGNSTSYGRCYTNASHTHTGNAGQGGAGTCFAQPVYHQHFDSCYDGYGNVVCGMSTSTVIYYNNTCGKTITYQNTCGKEEGRTIDYYTPGCSKTEDTVEQVKQQGNTALTDNNGHYEFSHLNAMRKYYVKFTYNGMLYTNVRRLQGNADDISKATEAGQGHDNNRQTFNNVFAEIGSYPQNYKTRDCITGAEIYNRTFLQEEIADLFKEIAATVVAKNGDEKAAYQEIINKYQSTDGDIRKKVQFIADNRISAYTTDRYPLISIFTIDSSNNLIGGVDFKPIYGGAYNQLHVNLGIKARPIFDLALYKDVFNAVLEVNGKTETYTYDVMQDWQNEGFSFGVNEDDYIKQLRNKYISGHDTNMTTKELIDSGEYSHEYRSEEIINGNNSNTNINESQLFNENKNYSWRDINHNLSQEEKLKIHITYKLAIRNQSGVVGSVTELVDYYDNHYQFEKAYVGDKNGNQLQGTSVEVSETSKYGATTQYGTDGKYKTIYLRPTEQKLHNDSKEQYVYVTFGLINPEQTLIDAKLPSGEKLYTYNLAEINGYKTYGVTVDDNSTMGLVDKDSNPGNFTPTTYVRGTTRLEDDESQAPAFVYSIRNSRTLEGNVFEDAITSVRNPEKIVANQSRFGNGTIDSSDKKIKDVKVELVEVKQVGNDKKLIVRSTTWSDQNGWYGFGAFLPGNYVIRFTYGLTDGTAMTTTSEFRKGSNDTSYNGQDYRSTTHEAKQGEIATTQSYQADDVLLNQYNSNNQAKNKEEANVALGNQNILKYQSDNYYWYGDSAMQGKSDASDNAARRSQVNAYAKTEYGKEITNHKAEVFNSYINQSELRKRMEKGNFDPYIDPQPTDKTINTQEHNSALVDELERRTYQYAYTAEIPVELEYTTKSIVGNQESDKYTYKITGIDFGVAQRPRSELIIDQDVAHIKVTASDGSILFDTSTGVNNLQWVAKGDVTKYDKKELVNIILDDELLSGSKLEIRYNLTVTNNSEKDSDATTRAKTILNYVANNLNFEVEDNKDANGKALWEVVKKEDVQNEKHSTFVNNSNGKNNLKLIDLSTQTTILKTTNVNPLASTNLKPGESVTTTLVLKKTLSAESQSDDLSYSNMSEIVEIDNTQGRYDHGAVPGNQSLEVNPREHDTSGASRYADADKITYTDDGIIVVTPPTGSTMIYYGIGILATVILAAGIFLIKKFVIDKNK